MAIQHEQTAGHAALGDAATAGLEGRLAAQHHQRLADVEAALEAPDASYAPCLTWSWNRWCWPRLLGSARRSLHDGAPQAQEW